MKRISRKVLFALNLQDYMTAQKKSRADVCHATGIPYSTLSDWLQGTKFPRLDTLDTLASFLNVTVADLVEDRNGVGETRTSTSLTAEHRPAGADLTLHYAGTDLVGVPAKVGDTLVYVREQNTVQNGDLAALLIDGTVLLRRFFELENCLVLQSDNPANKPLSFLGEDRERVKVLGKVVAFISQIE